MDESCWWELGEDRLGREGRFPVSVVLPVVLWIPLRSIVSIDVCVLGNEDPYSLRAIE
jgi:hypothetical protein